MSDRSRIDNIDHAAAVANQHAADYRSMFAVILGLVPYKDGDQWCVLWGDNLQVGISAFGKTPYEAMAHFDTAIRIPKGSVP
jgi:hypothetical protein